MLPSLIEEAMLGKIYDEPKDDESNKPETNIVVRTNRLYPGRDSTISAFLAIAYDKQGNKVDSLEGNNMRENTTGIIFTVLMITTISEE